MTPPLNRNVSVVQPHTMLRDSIMPTPLGVSTAVSTRGVKSHTHSQRTISRSVNRYDVLRRDDEISCPEVDEAKVENSRPDGSRVPPVIRSDDVREKLALSLSTLLDLCEIYGFDRTRYDTTKTLLRWQTCSSECGWIKYLKYKFSAFFSYYLENEIPLKPFEARDDPSKIAGGVLGRWLRKQMCTDRAPDLALGILMLKKGLPRPGPDALAKAIVSTKIMLTTPHPTAPSDYCDRPALLQELRRTVRETLSGHHMTEKDLHHPYAPSIRANYTDSRSQFGTLGTLVDRGMLKEFFEGEVFAPLIGPNRPSMGDQSRWLYDGALEPDRGGEEEMEDEGNVVYKLTDSWKESVTRLYSEVYEKARSCAMDEEADVRLVALAEALKVRVISKGPALTYFVLKPVQKFLHRILRRKRVFALIGETVTPAFLSQVLTPRPRPEAEGDNLFHSLDYESATDLLDPEVSTVIVDEICDTVGLPPDIRILFHKSLTGHKVEGEQQVWGQLMGSITSFIVLCLANAAVCRKSYEISTSTQLPLNKVPLVVNGDDGLVFGPPSFTPIWKSIAASAGLKPSVGKVYTHPVYMNINSTSFEFDEGVIRHIPYVNMGLVNGLQRSGGQVSAVQEETDVDGYGLSMGARHQQLLDTCPEHLTERVHEAFMRRNMDVLKKVRVPWYAPESLGGVGLRPLTRFVGADDIDDCKVVTVHGLKEDDARALKALESPFYTGVRPSKVPNSQPILCRSVWSSRVGLTRRSHMKLLPHTEGFLDVATFFLLPRLVMLQKPVSTERLRQNERAWTSARAIAKYFEELGGVSW